MGNGGQRQELAISRQKYGEELRRRREAAGHTQESLADEVICSPSMIAHIEAGRRRPQLDDAQRIDKHLGTDGFFERFLPTLDHAQFADHFEEAAEAEQQASVIEEYAVSLVPGILQTEAYARAVFQATEPYLPAEVIDKRVVNRRGRARILDDPTGPRVWAILSENVIRTVVGGPAAMAEQL
ncbi:MAG TPA: Scr1 family TA system antitoxin-like transcriptional regulator, partial [Streptomyces sp.]|nr:Scr1 family TA system antitoxin-like transcriptional regulator [Streptomyces sp.]